MIIDRPTATNIEMTLEVNLDAISEPLVTGLFRTDSNTPLVLSLPYVRYAANTARKMW